MADISKIVDELSGLTVLEVAELVKTLEDKWGVSAAAPVAAVAVAGAAAGAAAPSVAGAAGWAQDANQGAASAVRPTISAYCRNSRRVTFRLSEGFAIVHLLC